MKKWFSSLGSEKQKKLIFRFWSATIIFFLIYCFLPVNVIALLFTFALTFSILFSILKPQNVSSNNNCTKENSMSSTLEPLSVKEETSEERKAQEDEIKKRREEFIKNKISNAEKELLSLPRYNIVCSTEKRNRQSGYEPIPFSNITLKGKYNEFVVFDTETTGLSPTKDRIIELAAIRFKDGIPTEVFESFVNPKREIPSDVSNINHITNEMVASAPSISEILPAFETFVGGNALVAHNLEFDLKFLFYSGSTITQVPRKYFDTLAQAKRILKKPKSKYNKEFGIWEVDYESDYDVYDYKLDTLADYYEITFPQQHRAAADAIVTGKVFLHMIEEKQRGY